MGPFAVPDVDFGLGKLHHVGIVVPDSEAAVQHFEDLYGLPIRLLPESHYHCRIDGIAHSTVQRLGLSIDGPPHVELLREIPETSVWQPHSGYITSDSWSTTWPRRRQPSHVAGHHCGWADSVTVGARSAPPITATHWG